MYISMFVYTLPLATDTKFFNKVENLLKCVVLQCM